MSDTDPFLDPADRLCYLAQRTWHARYGWPMPAVWEATWMAYISAHGGSAMWRDCESSETRARDAKVAAWNRSGEAQPVAGGGASLPPAHAAAVVESVRQQLNAVVTLPPVAPADLPSIPQVIDVVAAQTAVTAPKLAIEPGYLTSEFKVVVGFLAANGAIVAAVLAHFGVDLSPAQQANVIEAVVTLSGFVSSVYTAARSWRKAKAA